MKRFPKNLFCCWQKYKNMITARTFFSLSSSSLWFFHEEWYNLEASTAPTFSPCVSTAFAERLRRIQAKWDGCCQASLGILVLKRRPLSSYYLSFSIYSSIISSSTVFPLVSTYLSSTPRVLVGEMLRKTWETTFKFTVISWHDKSCIIKIVNIGILLSFSDTSCKSLGLASNQMSHRESPQRLGKDTSWTESLPPQQLTSWPADSSPPGLQSSSRWPYPLLVRPESCSLCPGNRQEKHFIWSFTIEIKKKTTHWEKKTTSKCYFWLHLYLQLLNKYISIYSELHKSN